MYRVGENYSVNYKTEKDEWMSFYVHLTFVSFFTIKYLISDVFSDSEREILTQLMETDTEVEWNYAQFKDSQPIEIPKKEMIFHGRCGKCGLKGEFKRMALVCRRCGIYGGI